MHAIRLVKINKASASLRILYLVCLSQLNIACTKNEPDPQTLHYITRDGISTTLYIEHEIYIADNNPDLFYINFRYYRKDKTGQWERSDKPDKHWKVVPDQGSVPKNLLLINSVKSK